MSILEQAIAAALIFAAGGVSGGWAMHEWDAGREAIKENKRLELVRRDELANRAAEREDRDQVIGAQNEARKREQLARVAADGARSELDSVRRDVTSFKRATSDAPASCPERANAAADVFEQCAAALTDLAGKADRHASDALMLLQAWPKP